MEEAYREYVTTSPSYHLLASARRGGARAGRRTARRRWARCIARTREFKAALRERLPRARPPRRPEHWLGRCVATSGAADLVKTTVGALALRRLGLRRREALVEREIVVEKAGVQTLTFITTFQLGDDAVDVTRCDALAEILDGHVLPGNQRQPLRRPTRSRRSTTAR